MIATIITSAIFISLFIVGLRLISAQGMVFYFLRKPYDGAKEKVKNLQLRISTLNNEIQNKIDFISTQSMDNDSDRELTQQNIDALDIVVKNSERQIKRLNKMSFWLKPVIGCGTCMASFWSLVIYPPIILLTHQNIMYLFLLPAVMIIAAGFNSLILTLHELMVAKQKCNCGK